MEIGSMDSMTSLMRMQGGMKGMQGGDASRMSSDFIDSLDSDGDGALSKSEFAINGDSNSSESTEVFDVLDTNEDGFVSQEELEADMSSKLDAMKAKLNYGGVAGIQQGGEGDQFGQLMEMMGEASGSNKARGPEAYSQMQQGMGGEYANQTASAGLNVTA